MMAMFAILVWRSRKMKVYILTDDHEETDVEAHIVGVFLSYDDANNMWKSFKSEMHRYSLWEREVIE